MKRVVVLMGVGVILFPLTNCTLEYKELWVYETDENGAFFSPPSLGDDGTVYVTDGHDLLAFSSDGELLWKYEGNFIGHGRHPPTIGSDGTIYAAEDNIGLHAVNPDGTRKWFFELGEFGISSPALGSDSIVYFTAGVNGLYALNPDGSLKWQSPSTILNLNHAQDWTMPSPSSPVVGFDGSIYVEMGNLYAYDTQGKMEWMTQISSPEYPTLPPALGDDGSIYVLRGLSVISLTANGFDKWECALCNDTNLRISNAVQPVIGYNDEIYLAAEIWGEGGLEGNYLYSFDYQGKLRWKLEFDNGFQTPAIGADGTIFLPCGSTIYAISRDGEIIWEFEAEGIVSTPAIDSDGTLFFSTGKILYAVGTDCDGLASTPWPKSGADNQNTGRVTIR